MTWARHGTARDGHWTLAMDMAIGHGQWPWPFDMAIRHGMWFPGHWTWPLGIGHGLAIGHGHSPWHVGFVDGPGADPLHLAPKSRVQPQSALQGNRATVYTSTIKQAQPHASERERESERAMLMASWYELASTASSEGCTRDIMFLAVSMTGGCSNVCIQSGV